MSNLSRLLTVTFILLGLTAYAEAQSNNVTLAARTAQGTIPTSPGTGTIVLGGTQASGIALNGSYGSVTITVTGGWSGTIIPEGLSCDVAGTWNAINVTPYTSSTAQGSITASGAYIGTSAGLCGVRLRGNTVATAVAVGTITASSSGGAGGGGGGGGGGCAGTSGTPCVVDTNASGNLYTAVTSAIPAGANSIGTLNPVTPWTPIVSAASDNHQTIITGAHTGMSIHATNNSAATAQYVRLYDAASGFNGCNSATGAVFAMEVPPGSGFSVALGGGSGITFANGISICITGAFGLTDTTNAVINTVYVSGSYR